MIRGKSGCWRAWVGNTTPNDAPKSEETKQAKPRKKKKPAEEPHDVTVIREEGKPVRVIDLSKPELDKSESVVNTHGVGGILFLCNLCKCEYTVRRDKWTTKREYVRDPLHYSHDFADVYYYKCPECGAENRSYEAWINWYLAEKEKKSEKAKTGNKPQEPQKLSLFRRIWNELTLERSLK